MAKSKNAGRFRKGNSGGPGRPKKLRPEELISFWVGDREAPPVPTSGLFADEIEYKGRRAEWQLFGTWNREIVVSHSDMDAILKVYRRLKKFDGAKSLYEAYQKWLADLESSGAD